MSVLRNDGPGQFTEERTIVGNRVHDTVIGDVTGDGSTDIAAVRLDEDTHRRHELHVLEQRPNGTFAPDSDPQLFDASTNGGVGTPRVAGGDLDGDGDLDLVVSGAIFEQAVLLNSDAAPGDLAVLHYPGGSVSTRIVDMDGDGDRDVVGADGGGGVAGTLAVRRNAGDGTFGPRQELVTGRDPWAVAVSDLDGDGRPDVLVPSRETGTGITHLQGADGRLGAPPAGQLFAPSVDVATGDVDGDGDQDVAAVEGDFTSGDTIDVMHNSGSGELTRVERVAAGGIDPRSLVTGDLDDDGDLDLSWLVGHGQFQRVATLARRRDGVRSAVPAPGLDLQ